MHPVWGLHDELRTARLNAKYYGVQLERLQRWNLFLEASVAVTASGSAVAGWSLWQSSVGKPLWSLVAALAAICAIVKPLLRTSERIRQYQEVLSGYRILDVDLQSIERLLE